MILQKSFIDTDEIVQYMADYLISSLKENNRVLWLLSGGSNIAIEVKTMDKIPDALTKKLIIGLIDERYGNFNHADSNFYQIKSANFNFRDSAIIEVIEKQSDSIKSSAKEYGQKITELLSNKNIFSIGQLGVGDDGHIAGILPDCSIIESPETVDSYTSKPFNRISFTPNGLGLLDQIIVVIVDTRKNHLIDKIFLDDGNDEKELPIKLLHRYNSVNIYNINNRG